MQQVRSQSNECRIFNYTSISQAWNSCKERMVDQRRQVRRRTRSYISTNHQWIAQPLRRLLLHYWLDWIRDCHGQHMLLCIDPDSSGYLTSSPLPCFLVFSGAAGEQPAVANMRGLQISRSNRRALGSSFGLYRDACLPNGEWRPLKCIP